MSEAPRTCSRCGVFLTNERDVLYSDAGDVLCLACRELIDRDRRDVLTAKQLFGASIGALAGSIFGLPISMLFVLGAMPLSLPALGVAWRIVITLPHITKGTETALGARRGFVKFAAGVALVFGGLGVIAMLIQIALTLFQLAMRPR